MPISAYIYHMARSAAAADVFNAIAESPRRAIIDLLARKGVLPVGAIVAALGLPQPSVSKHLGVLREVGLVAVERQGQHRLYRLLPEELKTMHDWLIAYEHLWTHQLDRVKQRAERMQRESETKPPARYL